MKVYRFIGDKEMFGVMDQLQYILPHQWVGSSAAPTSLAKSIGIIKLVGWLEHPLGSHCGSVAQLVEQCPFKALAAGSNPARPTNL